VRRSFSVSDERSGSLCSRLRQRLPEYRSHRNSENARLSPFTATDVLILIAVHQAAACSQRRVPPAHDAATPSKTRRRIDAQMRHAVLFVRAFALRCAAIRDGAPTRQSSTTQDIRHRHITFISEHAYVHA